MTRKKKPAVELSESNVAAQAAQEAVNFLMTVPEIAEAFSTADIQLAMEDRGWIGGSGYANRMGVDQDPRSRGITVTSCRSYWLRDPLAHQAVRLWTDYSFGDSGASITADDKGLENKVHAFMDDRRNKSLLSAAGQKRLSNKVLVDGEIFFAMFDDGTIRTYDPLQMAIITDPDDEETVLGYKRITTSNKTLYYADWTADAKALRSVRDPDTKSRFAVEVGVVVYHMKFDAFGKRGNGLLVSSLFWSREHRRFMEARVAITSALAKFAYKATIEGGPKAVAAVQAKIESSFASRGLSGGLERNPPSAPASTLVQNKGIDMVPMPRTTGASEARDDSEGLKLMVCAGTGIMSHYFGDPSTGNLATATAMELPMLKQFEGYQKLWKDTYRDLFAILLQEKPNAPPAQIDVDLPPILADDLAELGRFLVGLSSMFPEIKVPEILQMCLISLGINNVDELMKKIEEKRKEIEDQVARDFLVTGGPPVPKGGVPGSPPLPPGTLPGTPPKLLAQKQLKESYDALTKAIKFFSKQLG